MKRYVIILVLLVCLGVVAFATLQRAKNKTNAKEVKTEKQQEVKKHRDCQHSCPFS